MAAKRSKAKTRAQGDLLDAFFEALGSSLSLLPAAWSAARKALKNDKWARFAALAFAFALGSRLLRPDWYVERQFHPDERWLFGTVAELHWPELPGKATGDGAGLQYGSLPLYAAAAVKGAARMVSSDFPVHSAIKPIGRTITGLIDALSVLLIFFLGAVLFSRRVGALAALFLAFTPLNIQLSHFFTVDPWMACFSIATLIAAAQVARTRSLGWSVGAGVAYAAALASKSAALPLALPLLLAHAAPCFAPGIKNARERKDMAFDMGLGLGVAASAALFAFLIFMPMWTQAEWAKFFVNQGEQRNILVTGSPEGTPFVRQFWDTSILFHVKNLVLYYQGAALGTLGLLALAMGLIQPLRELWISRQAAQRKPAPGRALAGVLERHFPTLLILSWVLPYFLIVGVFSFAKFARYMLPLTPYLALLAAAWIEELWLKLGSRRALAWWLGLASLTVSVGYGFAYLGTYFRPHPWIETSQWMLGGGVPLMTVENGVPRRSRVYNENWGDDLPVDVAGGNAGSYDNRKINIVEWDSPRKLDEFGFVLSQADAMVMADARAYGTYLRIPTRFPLTYAYFETMMRDPGKLGFELAHESSNHMRLFGLVDINDSRIPSVPVRWWADESFTMYDRPHAFIFKRARPITPEEVKAVLEARVRELGLPESWRQGRSPEDNRRLAAGQMAAENPAQAEAEAKLNPNIGLSRGRMIPLLHPVLTWWLLMALLGALALPLCFSLFKNFPDGGYALARALGLFLFSWLAYNLSWLGAMRFYQAQLWILLLLLFGALFAWARPRQAMLKAWWLSHKDEVIWSEAIFAGAFLLFIAIRSFNPNIHDIAGQGYFGGGEPLGMTYLSAVTRCATFPVFDPWLALRDSSYYYFGYVIAGTLTKLSGFAPAITYNLSLALFFALSALSAYGVARALVKRRGFALAAAAAVAAFGALSSAFVFMAKLTSPGQGPFSALFSHEMIWDPTRFPQLVQGHIFEFPFFSYLYGDLHPHNMVIAFGLVLTALFLVPFKSAQSGWRSVGPHWREAALWAGLTALLLDAQYAINTWNWPVFLALGAGAMLVGAWAGKKQGLSEALKGAGAGALALAAAFLLGRLLMAGFRHYFIQDSNSRLGTVQPGEWQMVSYIPLAYFGFGLAGLGALGYLRIKAWWPRFDKALGLAAALRRGIFDALPRLVDRAFTRMPVTAGLMLLAKAAVVILLIFALPGISQGAVLSLSLGLGLSFFYLFCLRGWEDGEEAFLWMLGAFCMFLVAGSELKFVADRMNTIFKFWINGWILMGLCFGAGFAKWFESEPAAAKAPKRKAKSGRPAWLPLALGGTAVALYVLMGAWMDVTMQGRGARNAPSAFVLGSLIILPGIWAAFSPWQPRLMGKAVFTGLMALGLLYPLGAVVARLSEARDPKNPRLDGMAFMRERSERGPFAEIKDYDKYDAEAIDWLNKNADKTEVILEAPGTEMYKGYSRYSIYTGLPTLLGWDYQVGQQLGSRAGGVLSVRASDAIRIYATDNLEEAKLLLKRYQIRWIVVGGIERKIFAGRPEAAHFEKFAQIAKAVLETKGATLYRYDPEEAAKP